MTSRPTSSNEPPEAPAVGLDYSANQLQRALEAAARGEPAQERVRRWRSVIGGLLSGTLLAGSRQPVAGYPTWVTLEVVKGGFATGEALAAGPLLPFENALLHELGLRGAEAPRLALNRYFLSDAGLTRLLQALESRALSLQVPEEAALPTVAWLMSRGHADEAGQLVQALAPLAHALRFYPKLDAREPVSDALVHLETAGQVVKRLRAMRPNKGVLAQRDTVSTWLPYYDAAVALVLETVEGDLPIAARDDQGQWRRREQGQFLVTGGWPFNSFTEDWSLRARRWLSSVHDTQKDSQPSRRFTDPEAPFGVLRRTLQQAALEPQSVAASDVRRVRLIVARYVASHGAPGSDSARAFRERQQHAKAKTHQEIASDVAAKLAEHPATTGLEDTQPVLQAAGLLAEGKCVPPGVQRRLQRCVNDTPEGLIRRGVVTSGEVLAALLPQRTSQLRAAGFADADLRALYAATYRAFRRRRSLLLLNLQKQVQLEELPWVAAMRRFRNQGAEAARGAGLALEEFAGVALDGFPQTQLPNKLLQEFVALADEAGVALPLTEELAADIFMGAFSPKFARAAQVAAAQLQGSPYERYYRLDYQDVAARLSIAGTAQAQAEALAKICTERAGKSTSGAGVSRAASNGRIIEQQLIVTTHNLAALLQLPGMRERLVSRAMELVRDCYGWVLRHLQLRSGDWRVELHRVKNAAYAWRQMVFFLSLRPSDVPAFLAEAQELLDKQSAVFAKRFQPALDGLRMAVEEPHRWTDCPDPAPFLGWWQTDRWRTSPQGR